MTRLTIRVATVHRKPNLRAVLVQRDVKRAIALDADLIRVGIVCVSTSIGHSARPWLCGRGSEEGVAAFGAEEVLLVVGALAECRVIEGDETFVDDGCFAVVARRGEELYVVISYRLKERDI